MGEMPAGKRDRRIAFERLTYVDNGLEKVPTWALLDNRWAEKHDVSDREKVAAAEVGASITTRFRVVWDSLTSTLTPKDRIVYAGLVYEIAGIKEIGRREGIELSATARNDLEAA